MWYNLGMADTEILKVGVLLEHYEGDPMWTAHVPAIEGQPDAKFTPLAEGPTPEEAAAAIIPELTDGVQKFPGLADQLRNAPKLAVAEVDIPVPNNT